MLVEATTAAMTCCSLLCRGWDQAARGLVSDIEDRWGDAGVARMAYVWATAVAILPEPKGGAFSRFRVEVAGASAIAQRMEEAGMEATPEAVSQAVSLGDQATGHVNALADLALREEAEEFINALESTVEAHDGRQLSAVLALLMAKGAERLGVAAEDGIDDDPLWVLAKERFTEHVNAHLPDDEEDEEDENDDSTGHGGPA